MYYIKFTFNGVNRKRELPSLPRVGEIVDLHDGDDERVILRVDLVVHFDEGDGKWTWHCNCTQMSNWLGFVDKGYPQFN
jgi:hypothetical protein